MRKAMTKKATLLLLTAILLLPALARAAANAFAGRWDITITDASETYPGWLQLTEKDGKTEVMAQPRSGHAHPVEFSMDGSRLIVTVAEPSERRPGVIWELTAHGGKLSGTQKMGDRAAKVAGVRAPALKRPMPAAWTNPEPIFNGKDLSGWEPLASGDHANNHWSAKDGVLLNAEGGANLKTTRKFDDFKLHVEFNCPEQGNSGIYLRGRYEVQLSCGGRIGGNPVQALGAVYGYLAPAVQVPIKAGEWQTYDITLVGRTVTVVLNGTTLIDKKEIPGITGGALDSNEGEPGPFYIQGDHTGGIQFRNITIALPKS
jgi:hypothetical protein